jgi:hypothetical protein
MEDMAEFCPNLAFTPTGPGGFWRGVVQPIQSLEHIEELLDDICHHRHVYAAPRGELHHLIDCRTNHCRHPWMDLIADLRIAFEVEIYYDGTREHPKCWVLSPIIPPEKQFHMWADGSICPFLASEDAWVPNRHTVADFIPHVSLWLVTWAVFDQTGVWIAGEHGGTPEYHLEVVRPSDQCWCRSGRKYRKCHMHEDQRQAVLRKIRGLSL